jgi:hypothetical protein
MLHIKYPLPVESVAWRSMALGTVEIDHDRCFSPQIVHFVKLTLVETNSLQMPLHGFVVYVNLQGLRIAPMASTHPSKRILRAPNTRMRLVEVSQQHPQPHILPVFAIVVLVFTINAFV